MTSLAPSTVEGIQLSRILDAETAASLFVRETCVTITRNDVSVAYAANAGGTVGAVVGGSLRPENIWENVELPALKSILM